MFILSLSLSLSLSTLSGELKCLGTAMQLKNKFGSGYTFTIQVRAYWPLTVPLISLYHFFLSYIQIIYILNNLYYIFFYVISILTHSLISLLV